MSFWSKQKQSVWRIDVYSVIVKEEGGNKENAVEETEENPEEVEDFDRLAFSASRQMRS